MPLQLNCQKCGLPLPPIDDETEEGKEYKRSLLRGGVELKHDVCPDEREARELAKPKLRRFEARVEVVEILAPEEEGGDATKDTLTSFIAYVDGPSFAEACRPLALNLGERWMEVVEKPASFHDLPRDF